MHEFLLYSQIPAGRHDQVLHILAGVTASQPTPIREQTLIYQQLKLPDAGISKRTAAANKPNAQAARPSFHKLVRDLNENDGQGGPWKFRAEEVPQPGVTNVISRPVTEIVVNGGELERFRQGVGWYKYINQYIAPGHRFIHNQAIIIRVTRIQSVPEGTGALEPLDAPVPNPADCMPVDPSGTFLFEACIRVEDGSNSTLTSKAMDELMAFKKLLDGAVDLKVPERLSLDTRVKGA